MTKFFFSVFIIVHISFIASSGGSGWANPKKNFVAILFRNTRGCRNVEKIVTLFLRSKFQFCSRKLFSGKHNLFQGILSIQMNHKRGNSFLRKTGVFSLHSSLRTLSALLVFIYLFYIYLPHSRNYKWYQIIRKKKWRGDLYNRNYRSLWEVRPPLRGLAVSLTTVEENMA